MSFQYSFFSDSIRYLTACGQIPTSDIALSANSTCVNSADNDSTVKLTSLQLTWGALQGLIAFALWVSTSLIGVRAARGSSAIIPSTISLFIAVSMIGHGVASAKNWTDLGFYAELGYWCGAFVLALLFYALNLQRIPLGAFAFVSAAGAGCMFAEFAQPGSISSANLNDAELCAIFASPIVVGAIVGGFCCKKRRLGGGTLFSAPQSGLDQTGMFNNNNDDDDEEDNDMRTVRFGGKGHIGLHVIVGSFCQAFVVAPLVFASCKFEGCPALWRLGDCHRDSRDPALAVAITTLVGSSVIGFIVQCCWAYRSVREANRNNYVANPELHNHVRDVGANDIMAEDRASRSVLKGYSTAPLDNRWSRMVQEGY